jgi:DNA-binding SARP family transcriptional activator
MRVGLLGPLLVTNDDRPVPLRPGKGQAILEALALAGRRGVGVAELVTAVWDEEPPATATKTLHAYISRLRAALPAGAIVSGPGRYSLAVDPDDVDANVFQRNIEKAAAALADGRPNDARDRLTLALGLWRGSPVPELASQPGGQAARARLEELHRTAEELLGDARLELGEHATAVASFEDATRCEPLRERRWAQLMVALYRSGRQADALRAFQRARSVLIEQLGIEPGPDLRRLERLIIDQDTDLARPPSAVSARSSLPATLAAVAATPIVGRDEEVAQLEERWKAVRAGHPSVVLISGESGIGKTRVLAEIARIAYDDGANVLFGRCDPEMVAPFQPFVEAMPTAFEGERFSNTATRLGLLNAITSFLERAASSRPVLLGIDDAHWADPGTLLMLRHLTRSSSSLPLLIAFTARDDDVIDELRRAVPPEISIEHIHLGGLDALAIEQLLGADAVHADEVARVTGGSPLFVTELLRHREATGRILTGDEVPDGLRHAVARRLDDLGAHGRRIMQAAAVAGGQFDLAIVARAAGITTDDAIDAADAAIRARVLVEDPSRPRLLAFAHAVVRTAVLHDLSASRRSYLHERVADAIIAHDSASKELRAAELAFHFAAAAGDRTSESAATWSMAAGRAAMQQLAWETAADHFGRALHHYPAQPIAPRIEALLGQADAERLSGAATSAKSQFMQAIELARDHQDPDVFADAVLSWAAVPVDIRRESAEAIALLREAVERCGASGPRARRAELLARLAFSLGWANHAEATTIASDAMAIARATSDDLTIAKVLAWAESTVDPFAYADPMGIGGELTAIASRSPDPRLAARATIVELVGAWQRADRARVDHALDRLRDLAVAQRDVELAFRVRRTEADLMLLDGHIDHADRRANELLQEAMGTDLRNLVLFASSLLYDVRRLQGRLPELLPFFDLVVARGERIPKVAAMRVEVLHAAGRYDDARSELQAMVAGGFHDVAPPEQPHSFATLANVAADFGAAIEARALHQSLQPWAGLIVYDGTGGVLDPVDDYLARLSHLLDDAPRAESGARRANSDW